MELNRQLVLKIVVWGKAKCLSRLFWRLFIKFGKFVFVSFFLAQNIWAQSPGAQKSQASPVTSGSQKGTIVAEESDIYQEPDFDSKVIGHVTEGQVFDISAFPKGPFYKIRLKPGVLGWIADTDVKPLSAKQQSANKTKPEKKKKEVEEKKDTNKKPFLARKYRGPTFESINWTEDTMGVSRTETMSFYGVNFAGYNTVFSGDVYTDANILMAFRAPKYYQNMTGNSASGWILKMNFDFETPLPQTKYYMVYYGFGPSFTYSHFDVALTESGKNISYSLDDMSIGAVFNIGLAFKLATTSPRVAFKYYWEKKQMTALALSFGFEF